MPFVDETPTFNLKAVTQVTGLKADTLRAWERRYGLPAPERTSGRHRLYSQRDVETLKWLMARQGEGLSISRAVALWNELEAADQDPIVEYTPGGEAVPGYASLEIGDSLVQQRNAWVENCLEFEEQFAEQVLAQAFSLYAPETVCIEVLQKGLAQIGQRWYEDEATVQQEHFASALAIRKLEALLAALPAPSRAGRIIVGCPPHEEHIFAPLLLTYLLRRQGRQVIFLGANVPLDSMKETLDRNQPRLVVLSAQTLPSAATMLDMGELLLSAGVTMAFGGLIFNLIPGLIERIPGHFLGNALQDAPAIIEKLMHSPKVVDAQQKASGEYQRTWQAYREKQMLIESLVWLKAGNVITGGFDLQQINTNLAHYMIAALRLGDLSLLNNGIEWLQGLLSHHSDVNNAGLIQSYLHAYGQAVSEAMGPENSALILSWLNATVPQ